jgi:hypothetical protein
MICLLKLLKILNISKKGVVNMSWRRWKLSLIIAAITGICSGGVVAFIDPNISGKNLVLILAYNICQNALLFLKDHPVEKITDNTEFITNPSLNNPSKES